MYTVHHHHVYIAVGRDVIVLLLNADTPNFHRIGTGKTPLRLVAHDFGEETYLYVLYETDSRGYVAAYRKYSNRIWGKHGQYDLQVYSPDLFDVTKISNIIFFEADDWHYSYKVTYVAVAVGYTIYFKEILDDFEFSINIPAPCDRILSINFNEIKQTLFVVCGNITYYFSYSEYRLYQSSLWNRTGETHFTHDGKIAAILTNHSGDMTTVTIHGLHFEPVVDGNERVYQFHHFHHVASRSLIIRGQFISASSTLHYFCYIEQLEFGIVCINVEQALMNIRTEGVLVDATVILPNTRSVMCSSSADCPVMYSHKDFFAVQVQHCEQDASCESIVMLFNMSSLENIANITGASLDVHAYKSHPHPILISPPPNMVEGNRIQLIISPSVTAESSTTVSVNAPGPTQGTVPNCAPTSILKEAPPTATDATSHEDTQDLLDTCQNDLIAITTTYDHLLYVTISLCVCFCVAMVITILLLVVMIYFSKREKINKK